MKFTIRKVPHITNPALRAILSQRFYHNIHRYQNDPHQYWWLVFDQFQNEVGFGGAYRNSDYELYLGPTYIIERCRGFGLQRKLISKRLRWGRLQGFQYVVSYVDSNNIFSANNLIKAGFLLMACTITTELKFFKRLN
jgi:GNAT superfamily N-acetyltransferase